MKKVFSAAMLFVALAACGCGKGDRPLEGTTWKLVSMEGIPASAITSEDDAFTLSFNGEETLVNGRTNCNRFFGSYDANNGALVFGDMGMTRMACPDMEYEDVFVRMLSRVDGYEVEGDRLVLSTAGQTVATFTAVEETE